MSRSSDRDGSLMQSFLHRPLLIFHETGHMVFMPFGEWMSVAGALLCKNRDPFGAALGLWLLGWAAWVLKRQRARLSDAPYVDED